MRSPLTDILAEGLEQLRGAATRNNVLLSAGRGGADWDMGSDELEA